MLNTIIKKFAGGPVGVETIASAIGEEVSTLEDVVSITKGYPVQGIDENLKRKVYNNYRAYRKMVELAEEGSISEEEAIKTELVQNVSYPTLPY